MPEQAVNAPDVSVIVCTRNGKARLAETLESLRCQARRAASLEVIVVDNASDDGTAEWLESHQADYDFRLVHEPRLGLSHARNAGIEESEAPWIYFIDDDAVAASHWVDALFAATRERSADIVGGPALGLWTRTPPRGLTSDIWRGLSLVHYGPETRYLRFPEIVIGCNIGFRRHVLDELGGFDPDLGRTGASLAGGEERALQQRLAQRGGSVLWVPRGYVFHTVPEERMTPAYYERRTREGTVSMLSYGDPQALAAPGRKAYQRMIKHAVGVGKERLDFGLAILRGRRQAHRG